MEEGWGSTFKHFILHIQICSVFTKSRLFKQQRNAPHSPASTMDAAMNRHKFDQPEAEAEETD